MAKTDHTGKQIRNFTVITKTDRKKKRPNGRSYFIYLCKCSCGKDFESNASEFEWRFGCNDCSKKHHYDKVVENMQKTLSANPSRRTALSVLSPASKGNIKGSYANYIVNWIKGTATKRNLIWNLDSVDVFYMIQESCFYCGHSVNFPDTRNGLDRIDNTKGYIPGNVVACCFTCNIAKHEMTIDEFKQWSINLYERFGKK